MDIFIIVGKVFLTIFLLFAFIFSSAGAANNISRQKESKSLKEKGVITEDTAGLIGLTIAVIIIFYFVWF